MNLTGKRSPCLLEILLIAAWASSGVVPAFANEMHRFNVPAEPAAAAIRDFASQAKVEILVAGESVRSKRLHAVTGEFSTAQGLKILLADSGLAPRYVGARSIALVSAANPEISSSNVGRGGATGAENEKEGKKSSSSGFRMAQMAGVDSSKSKNPPSEGREYSKLQEITVTAQLYRQPAFDVPISLDVVSARDLEDWRTSSLGNLQYQVPGVYIETGGGFSRITIDGVGNGIGTGALVGEYVDEADITGEGNTGASGAGTGDVSLNDVERVEVLHGPQGTLYGDGSMGGVVRVITNKPDLTHVQFSSDVAAIFDQYGSPGQHIQTMLNVPLVAGTLGVRFAGDLEHDGGWIDEPEANLKNINSRNMTDARLEALWRPSEGLNVSAMQIVRHETYGIGFGEDLQGNIAAPLQFGLTTVPQGAQTFNLSNITVSSIFGHIQLLNSATYFTHEMSSTNLFEQARVSASYSEYYLYRQWTYTSKDFSEELRLSNAGAGPWQWMVGGFYKHYDDTDAADEPFTDSTAAPIADISFAGFNTGSESTAAFVNSSYRVTPDLEFGAGVRYSKAHETHDLPTVNYHGYFGLGVVPGKSGEGDFASTDPRAFLRYQVTSDINTYVTASKGFREGGFNNPGEPNYQPETLRRYEVGLKSRLLDNSVLSNIDLFYSDYTNYVVEGYFPALNEYYSANAGTAHIKGVEVSVNWRLSSDWRLGLSGAYVDAHFVSITALDTGYAVGEQVPLVTKYSFSGSLEREFEWHGRGGYVDLTYSEISPVQYRATGYIVPIAQSDVMRFLNFNSAVHLNDHLSVGVFARNLLNDRGNLDPFWIYGQGSRPEPRNFGVDFRVRF